MVNRLKEWFKKWLFFVREKKNTCEMRFFFITAGAVGLTLVFLVLTLISVPCVPRVAKQLCRAIEQGNIKKIYRLIDKESDYPLAEYMEPEKLLTLYDPKTEWVKCSVGIVDFDENKNDKEMVILVSVFDKSGFKRCHEITGVLEKTNGRYKVVSLFAVVNVSFGDEVSGFGSVSDITADVKIISKNKIKQTVRIQYKRSMTDGELLARIRGWENKTIETLEQEYGFEFRHTTENGVSCVYITQKGTAAEIHKSNSILTPYGAATISTHDGNPFKIKNEVGLSCCLNYNRLAFEVYGVSGIADYNVKLAPGTFLYDGQGDNVTVRGRKWTGENLSSNEWITLVGERWNVWAIAFWIMLSVSIVCTMIFVKKYWLGIGALLQNGREVEEKKRSQMNIVIDEEELNDLDVEIDINEKM